MHVDSCFPVLTISSYLLYSDALTSYSLADPGGSAPSRVRQFLEITTSLDLTFQRQTSQFRTHTLNDLLNLALTSGSPSYLNYPDPGIRHYGYSLCLRAHWSYSILLILPYLFLPEETILRALTHSFPIFLCLWPPVVALHGWCLSPLGIYESQTIFSMAIVSSKLPHHTWIIIKLQSKRVDLIDIHRRLHSRLKELNFFECPYNI